MKNIISRYCAFFLLILLLGCAAVPQAALATWSIVAVDLDKGEVGSAGASCTGFVAGIVDGVPGRGILVAQARSNSRARAQGVRMLRSGASPNEIIAAVANEAFDPHFQEQQYGVVSLQAGGASAAFTGDQTHGWSGQTTASDFAVQGNTLTGPDVLQATVSSFEASTQRPLAERLLMALEAGSQAGGDHRCGEQAALSSYLVVAKSTDSRDAPYLRLVVPGQKRGAANPVQVLRERFDLWRAEDNKSGLPKASDEAQPFLAD